MTHYWKIESKKYSIRFSLKITLLKSFILFNLFLTEKSLGENTCDIYI